MTGEDDHISQTGPEEAAAEAAWAQLRPRRQGRLADEVKSQVKAALSDNAPSTDVVTTTVRIPLTHYIRIAQFNAAAGGLLAGLVMGMVLGGAAVYWVMDRLGADRVKHVQTPFSAYAPYVRLMSQHDASQVPLDPLSMDQILIDHVLSDQSKRGARHDVPQ